MGQIHHDAASHLSEGKEGDNGLDNKKLWINISLRGPKKASLLDDIERMTIRSVNEAAGDCRDEVKGGGRFRSRRVTCWGRAKVNET